jgi:thiamine-monophosphate kinase
MEQSFIAWLQGRQKELPQVALGIGDDAAIIDSLRGPLVVSVDTVIDGVDFLLDQHGAKLAGRKALAVNLSDMAAMAARPIAIVVALSLPEENATRLAGEIFEGIIPLAKQYGVAVAGGDISCYRGPLSITITILGEAHPQGSTLRSGAQPGDALVVTGSFGGSILGKHLDFSPRVVVAHSLRNLFDIHAAIDVSDGLSLDLDRLCAASSVGVELDLATIPLAEAAHERAKTSGSTPFDHAWGDGEDFELILAVPADQVQALLEFPDPVPRTRIGTFTGRTGLWAKEAGSFRRLSPQGFIHGTRG